MSWKWPKIERQGLARYALPDAARNFALGTSRYDLAQGASGRRNLANAIYSSLQSKKINYALEKYNGSDAVQLIRTPSEIIEQKEGTCLDLALLFCGVCLGNELLPLIVLIQGHALAAVSLSYDLRTKDAFDRSERQFFHDGLITEEEALRNLAASGAYLPIECTGFSATQKLPAELPEGNGRDFQGLLSFDRAVVAGTEQLSRADRPFLFALDIAAALHDLGVEATTDNDAAPAVKKNAGINVGEDIKIKNVEKLDVKGRKGNKSDARPINVFNRADIEGVKEISIVGEEIIVPTEEKE